MNVITIGDKRLIHFFLNYLEKSISMLSLGWGSWKAKTMLSALNFWRAASSLAKLSILLQGFGPRGANQLSFPSFLSCETYLMDWIFTKQILFLSQYLFITKSQYHEHKCLVCNGPNEELNFSSIFCYILDRTDKHQIYQLGDHEPHGLHLDHQEQLFSY